MRTFACVLFFTLSFSVFSQNNDEKSKGYEKPIDVTLAEYMIGLPDIDNATLEIVKERLSQTMGVNIIGYCVQHKILYLTAPLSQQNEKNFTDAVHLVQPDATVNFKTGTFQSSLNDCAEMYKIINPN